MKRLVVIGSLVLLTGCLPIQHHHYHETTVTVDKPCPPFCTTIITP